MTEHFKSNDNIVINGDFELPFELPLPPDLELKEHSMEMEIYARFMRHLRMMPGNEGAVKILSAIQFTADMLDLRDALVAKTLVDLGLRAPRRAFPSDYLDHSDETLMRPNWHVGGPALSLIALKRYWDGNQGNRVTN